MANALNGKDLKALFGVQVIKTDDFLNRPKPKDSLENDFQDQDGLDKDLSARKLASRTFELPCALIATSRDDFHTKYDGLFTELTKGGLQELYLEDLDRTYYLYYEDQQPVTKLTQIDREHVGIKFTIIFSETDPLSNITIIYLIDDQDRYLTA